MQLGSWVHYPKEICQKWQKITFETFFKNIYKITAIFTRKPSTGIFTKKKKKSMLELAVARKGVIKLRILS